MLLVLEGLCQCDSTIDQYKTFHSFNGKRLFFNVVKATCSYGNDPFHMLIRSSSRNSNIA